jgi:undecaprenyl phosphate-alpha-L-ara4N flippase subunit ArnE
LNALADQKNRQKQRSRKAQEINCWSDFSRSFSHTASDPSQEAPDKSRQLASDLKNASANWLDILLAFPHMLSPNSSQVLLNKSVLGAVRWYLWISFGVVILLIETMIYSEALLFLAVGAAYAISSLNLISVTFMPRCLLREKVTRMRWIGVGLIFIGVSLAAART